MDKRASQYQQQQQQQKQKQKQKHPLAGHTSGQSNKPLSRPAHGLSWEEVLRELDADASQGLSAADAAERLVRYGANELKQRKGVQPFAILMQQILNAMTL
ncbi:hypothetical protein E4U43_005305, partial [Claviceps pusilla]